MSVCPTNLALEVAIAISRKTLLSVFKGSIKGRFCVDLARVKQGKIAVDNVASVL
jgi:hypothetical protein